MFYRVTYNNKGIYNELKKVVSKDIWFHLLSLPEFTWLSKPPTYVQDNRSYFTQKGYERFQKDTFPIIEKYLDKKNIKVETLEKIDSIIYSDEYQVISENQTTIPESVLEYGFDFDWEDEDIWKLDYPTQEIPKEMLEWHLDVPFWNWNHEWYVLKPRDVIDHPEKYKAEYDRIMNSDISYPIDVMENKERLVILDGLHRFVKGQLLGYKKVKVRIIPRSEIPNISK